MKYQFRPYAKMQPTTVTLTGKVYEKGEHPLYKDFRIIEVVDKEDEIHYAFEDELKPDEVKEQERSYSEDDMIEFGKFMLLENHEYKSYQNIFNEWFEQFKNK